MENDFKDFYDVLQDNLDSYKGEYAPFIDCGPELFKLLTEILDHKDLNSEFKLKISAAIAYYVVPRDVIPEKIYGPYGYIDDIFISSFVIKEIANAQGYEFMEKSWKKEEKLKSVVETCYERSKEVLGDKTHEVLRYVGLI